MSFNLRHLTLKLLGVLCISALSSCNVVNYSFSGASISPEVQTVSIQRFQNNATMVAPILSTTLTEGLQDRFSQQTRLSVLSENGDLNFEGEIINYTSTPASVSADEYTTMNRLTITVRVRFTNALEPQYNYDKTFSAYEDYSTSTLLTQAEATLIPQISEQLIEDIFNAAVANW